MAALQRARALALGLALAGPLLRQAGPLLPQAGPSQSAFLRAQYRAFARQPAI